MEEAKNEYEIPKDMEKEYSEESFFDKIIKFAKVAGIKTIYVGLLLYYTLKKSSTPKWAKTTIIGALGYFIAPFDAIPDLTPIIGFSDDFGVLVLALITVAMFIDDEVKSLAKNKLKDWFGEYNEDELKSVDDKIKK